MPPMQVYHNWREGKVKMRKTQEGRAAAKGTLFLSMGWVVR